MNRIASILSLALATTFVCTANAGTTLRFRMDVLPGLLVRAGGPGGQHSLPDGIVGELCEEGFSAIYYLYPTVNFANRGSHSCGKNTVDYEGGGFTAKGVRPIFERVYETAQNGGGPILVHCWNGWHATGEVSAYALKQFCGWDGERAAQYWAANIADRRNLSKYGGVMNRIRQFQPFNDLQFNPSQQSQYCPR